MKTHCPNGHEMTPENTYTKPKSGKAECRACRRADRNAWYHANVSPRVKPRTPRREATALRPEKSCTGCGRPLPRGNVCNECAVCRCGSGLPPGLCHGVSKSGHRVEVCK